jgi:hypothetical protein
MVTLLLKGCIANGKIDGMDIGNHEFPMQAGDGVSGDKNAFGTADYRLLDLECTGSIRRYFRGRQDPGLDLSVRVSYRQIPLVLLALERFNQTVGQISFLKMLTQLCVTATMNNRHNHQVTRFLP